MTDILILGPQSLDVTIHKEKGAVLIRVDLGADQQFLPRPVAFHLTSEETRRFAQALLRAAASVEGG